MLKNIQKTSVINIEFVQKRDFKLIVNYILKKHLKYDIIYRKLGLYL